MVVPPGLEPGTSTLSRLHSNQLSYETIKTLADLSVIEPETLRIIVTLLVHLSYKSTKSKNKYTHINVFCQVLFLVIKFF